MLSLAIPIPSLLAHVLPVIWHTPEPLLETAVIISQRLWSWFLVKAEVMKVFSFFQTQIRETSV